MFETIRKRYRQAGLGLGAFLLGFGRRLVQLDNVAAIFRRTTACVGKLLPEDNFFRLHQSHIVQRNFVRKVLKEDGGYVAMKDGSKIPLAKRRKQAFMEWVVGEFERT